MKTEFTVARMCTLMSRYRILPGCLPPAGAERYINKNWRRIGAHRVTCQSFRFTPSCGWDGSPGEGGDGAHLGRRLAAPTRGTGLAGESPPPGACRPQGGWGSRGVSAPPPGACQNSTLTSSVERERRKGREFQLCVKRIRLSGSNRPGICAQ